jgi:hypothetical protein
MKDLSVQPYSIINAGTGSICAYHACTPDRAAALSLSDR